MRAPTRRPFVRVRAGLGVSILVALAVIGMPVFVIAQVDRAQAGPTPIADVAVVAAAPASPSGATETGAAALASPRGAGTSTTSLAALSLGAGASTGCGASFASRPTGAASSSLAGVTGRLAAEGRLADATVLVRGGTHAADRVAGGAGVEVDAAGNVHGVSVNSGRSVEEAAQGIPHKQTGVSSVGDVRAAGGYLRPDPLEGNPGHCLVGGISAEVFSGLFTPTIANPCL